MKHSTHGLAWLALAAAAPATGPAWQLFEEGREGLLAGFVILSANPAKTGVDEIRGLRVLETIREGETIFAAN